jgi:2-C-methyl-D-erythritol 4-phosphate cytidylyltransferase
MNDDGIAAVVLAAGSSSRMRGIKKEYQKLSSGLTVLESSVRAFASVPSINVIVIAVCKNDEPVARNALSSDILASCKPNVIFVTGGKTRSASVFNALSALVPHNPRYVLIHDGARPRVSPRKAWYSSRPPTKGT